MKNMADAIESFIVGQLLAASKNTVLVQRNELAPGKGVSGGVPPGQRGIYPYRQDIACGRTAGRTDRG